MTARGDHRQEIFSDDRDHGHFVELLEKMSERFRVRVMAYVCMGNHWHGIIRTPEANLSRAIQWLNISYSVGFNKRHEETGHVFQGRYKSIVVEGEVWGLELSQYVHLNPVRTRFEDVVAEVERLKGERWPEFCERHGDKRRDLVLWVARRCTGLTLVELGRKAGGMDYAAVTMAVRRFPWACKRDKTLARLTEKVFKMVEM